MVFVDQSCTILGQVNKNKPKLIKENKAIQSANKFRFSFWSTICPANKAMDKAGIISISPIIPRDNGSLVKLYTCHYITIKCMDQANTKANRNNKKMLNSLIRKAA